MKATSSLRVRKGDEKESTEQNILDLQQPTQLLKFGSSGKPGFRFFQLSPDLGALSWQSTKKNKEKTQVELKNVKELRFGQRTDKFKRHNRPDLEQFSFSIIYVDGTNPNESLDLVCKDEKEFQTWTKTLQALIDGKIDKQVLAKLASQAAEQKILGDTGKGMNTIKAKTSPPTAGQAFQGSNDVYSFGWGEWGQNGTKGDDGLDGNNATAPKLIEGLLGKGVIQVACGWSHTGVLLETGAIMQYGARIGTGLAEDAYAPSPVKLPDKVNIVSVSCGGFHSSAVSDKGQVFTWGCNVHGQLGHGDTKDIVEPKLVEGLVATPMGLEIFILHTVCGGQSTAALADDGHVYTWGCGEHGALGHNDTKDLHKPKVIKDLVGTDISRIAAGDSHMFACTKSEMYAWGWNGCGQLGLDHEEDQYRPAVIESLRGMMVEDLSCGAAHTVAIVYVAKVDAHMVYSWGSNAAGQIGQGKKKRVLKPIPVPLSQTPGEALKLKPVEVACGAMHTLVRTEDGDVFATGLNKFGQLGHGTTQDQDEFKAIEFLKGKNARLLSCGGQNSSVLTARQWVEDSEAKSCMSCKAAFTFVNRKHHCRNCGGIFCNACSNKKAAILKYGLTEPVRVCQPCYAKLGGR